MLQFFRRHQKIFFIFVTVIVVTSFVFFGTYQTFVPTKKMKDEVVGYTIGGKKVYRNYLAALGHFLSNESVPGFQSRQLTMGLGNFFNDGVITNDFFQTGMGELLFQHDAAVFETDLEERLVKEKVFTPYVHTSAPFLSTEMVWNFFAPEMKERLTALQNSEGASDKEGFQKRIALFLAERQFPPAFIGQAIRYQMREHKNISVDPRLAREDFFLFGYHNLQDWFGPRFIECVAGIVMNSAELARKQGYKVSREEILSELLSKNEKAYTTLKEQVALPVKNSREFFQVALQQMGLDEATLIAIWEDVTLFRRLFHDVGSGAMVDTTALDHFYTYANQYATVELMQMPQCLRFQNDEALKRFEIYLYAVSGQKEASLELPLDHDSLDEIEKRAPELVGRQFRLYVGHVDKKHLQSKVSVKETWNWEFEPANWKLLIERFPELASKKGSPFEVLESLDSKMRTHVDAFARSQIVEMHSEWLEEALKGASMEERTIFVSANPVKKALSGIEDIQELITKLDELKEVSGYTQDGENYYRILVMDSDQEKRVLTYQQAIQEGVFASLEKKVDGEELLSSIITALEKDFGSIKKEELSAYRFFRHLKNLQEEPLQGSLSDQWTAVKQEKTLCRAEPSFIDFDKVWQLEPEQKSDLLVDPKEGAFYCKLLEHKTDTSRVHEKVIEAQEILSQEIRCCYLKEILSLIDQKGGVVFTRDA